jgi:hypothetical protein
LRQRLGTHQCDEDDQRNKLSRTYPWSSERRLRLAFGLCFIFVGGGFTPPVSGTVPHELTPNSYVRFFGKGQVVWPFSRCCANRDHVPKAVSLWQQAVHVPGIYDLEVDTSLLRSEECADVIRQRLENGPPPTAYQRLADMATGEVPHKPFSGEP